MSERQARLKRKNEEQEVQHHHKKRSKGEIITNVVIGVVIAACVGLGGWAIADKQMSKVQQTSAQDQTSDVQQDAAAQQQVPTIEEYAQSIGMTAEDFIKEYGLDKAGEEISPSMEMTLATEYMTLGNYAKLQGQDVDTVKQSMGLEDKDYNEDTMMSEVLADMETAAAAAGEQAADNGTDEQAADTNSAE